MPDLLIRGAGPAGAVLAVRARARGWRVTLVDPRIPKVGELPPWKATYGALDPELPAWALEFFGPPVQMNSITVSQRVAPFSYRMLSPELLRSAVQQSGAELTPSPGPELERSACCVVDCTGAPVNDGVLWQVAVGLVIPFSFFDDATSTPAPVFMDWSQARGPQPSFLYIQHVEDGVLFEETILATHESPQHMHSELENRLRRRLSAQYPRLADLLESGPELRRELVAIPMGTRRRPFHATASVDPTGSEHTPLAYFGASGGLIHPATGYSVGSACAMADRFLDALVARSGLVASDWTRKEKANAELAHALRRLGAELITRADGETLRSFFDAFFALSPAQQLAYLTGHDGMAVARTMWALRTHTGFRHPFLMPLWETPRQVLRAVWKKTDEKEQ